ncbi:MAG: EF-hand domain-containing protein [Proteobacteria bacterium]|nr:EF-hand domain-containing protein [Pseudomonadota bacterium]
MKTKNAVATVVFVNSLISCTAINKGVVGAQGKLNELNEKFDSFDLGCSFDDISGEPGDDSKKSDVLPATSKVKSTCDKAQEYYAMLLKKFDENHDGKLSEDELLKAKNAYVEAQKLALDKNLDGSISDEEIAAWRNKEIPARKEVLVTEFAQACAKLEKDEDSCKALIDVRREDRRQETEKKEIEKKEIEKKQEDVRHTGESEVIKVGDDSNSNSKRDVR